MADWGNQVDVVGYCFMNLGSKYQPSEEFAEWIQNGSPPIYIGFGSMVGGNGISIIQFILLSCIHYLEIELTRDLNNCICSTTFVCKTCSLQRINKFFFQIQTQRNSLIICLLCLISLWMIQTKLQRPSWKL